jgi:radical SAM protein with 4Fe4S-binding SPASM domain
VANEFNVDDRIQVPTELVKKNIDNKTIFLAPKYPNWIVLNQDESKLFEILVDENIINSLRLYCEKTRNSEPHSIEIMQSLLNKIDRSNFYHDAKIEDEEPIDKIKKNIQINITSDCNIRCKHCYLSAGSSDTCSIDHNRISETISELTRIIGTTEIVFSGGEPLTYKNLETLLRHSKSLGHKTVLFTNGILINKSNIGYISKYVDEIQISMEGITKEKFELIRGKNTYKNFMCSLELIKNTGIKLTLAITSIDSVIDDIEENLIKFLEKFNYKNLNVRISDSLDNLGRAVSEFPKEYFANNIERTKRINSLVNSVQSLGFMYRDGKQRNIHFLNCGIGASIVINSDGKIYPCNNFSVDFGNIEDDLKKTIDTFSDINKNTSLVHMNYCDGCELKYICSGGCRIENFIKTGSYLNPGCDNEYKDKKYLSLLIDYHKGKQ